MIVNTMTIEEIGEIVHKELPRIQNIALHLGENRKYRRAIIKQAKDAPFFFKPVFVDAPSGIKYGIIISCYSRKDFNKNGLNFLIFGTIYYRNSLFTVMPGGPIGYEVLNFYTHHCLDRYRERFLHSSNLSFSETLNDFYKRNAQIYNTQQNSCKYVDGITGSVHTGMLFGQKISPKIILWKTYVSNEMLKNEQVEKSKSEYKNIEALRNMSVKDEAIYNKVFQRMVV